MLRGENSQKAKRGQKRAITQLRKKNYIKFTNKRKQHKKEK